MSLLVFAFISGLLTILAPCIWPILPVVLSSSATGGKRTPLGITIGIMLSFGILTLALSYIVSRFSFDPQLLRSSAVIILFVMGLTLLIPRLSAWLERIVGKISNRFSIMPNQASEGFGRGLITGLSLGVVWTPCAGPILATIASLSATQSVNSSVVVVTIFYVLGVGVPLFILALLGRGILKTTTRLNKYTGRIQQIFGFIIILTAFLILTGFDRVLQVKLLDAFPSYSTKLTSLENNPLVQKELHNLKQQKTEIGSLPLGLSNKLSDYGIAPDFTEIAHWLNTEKPITIGELKGKVVLVDFWTYTCINCIRTLPHLTSWYEKYHDKGLVIIGVHTPEFEFEKKTENVERAITQYTIGYPVAQDNAFGTWNAYQNRYWPAKYLIDAKGHIRYTHFGEGEYDTTENAIRTLLEEAGNTPPPESKPMKDETPQTQNTAETYR